MTFRRSTLKILSSVTNPRALQQELKYLLKDPLRVNVGKSHIGERIKINQRGQWTVINIKTINVLMSLWVKSKRTLKPIKPSSLSQTMMSLTITLLITIQYSQTLLSLINLTSLRKLLLILVILPINLVQDYLFIRSPV